MKRVLLLCQHILLLVFVGSALASEPEQYSDAWLNQQLKELDEYSVQDPVEAVNFTEQLLDNHSGLSALQRAAFELELVSNYLLVGRDSDAQRLTDKLIATADELRPSQQVLLLLARAQLFDRQGKLDAATELYSQAEQQVQDLAPLLQAEVYSAIGTFYVYNDQEIKALGYFSRAYRLLLEHGSELQIAYLESSMAKTHEYLFDYDQALAMQTKALNYFSEHGLYFDQMVSLFNIGSIYIELNDPQTALEYFQAMLPLGAKRDDPQGKYFTYFGLALAYAQMGKTEQADQALDKSEHWVWVVEDAANERAHQFLQARIRLQQNRLEEAQHILRNIEQQRQSQAEQGSIHRNLELLELKAQLAKRQQDYPRAVDLLEQYIQASEQHYDSVGAVAKARHKVQFDTEQIELNNRILAQQQSLQELELEASERQHRLQQGIIFLGSLVLITVLAFSWRQYRLRQRFRALAVTDSLTAVANRRHIMDKVDSLWQDNQPFSVIACDIDHFKRINDEFGHSVGDDVLICVTKRFSYMVRQSDMLGRTGGEEFLVVLPDTDLEQAVEIAERLRNSLCSDTVKSNNHELRVTASFGVLQRSNDYDSAKALLSAVDKLLYQAKNSGRNKVIYE
ncbi:diguanylate cyclase [Pseudoalteromonas sp. Cnat2-41]|uniref:tetratricopeptide repeat-containing diguanylate cyclase n=1 Tax=unclassified Pseudoalteromonas TaxID=194690 RepID=UPI001EF7DD1B|nr:MULTISPECIES: GGDEF domain-containing protein [unclassified Pseudoalteromonas]MCF2862359.1 diguanylate cyclase [Pseudoalteromonas sp. CNAT2-18]MCG7557872.1 diguanylate cyclase [Pseudoalteromonas sp. CNAT2-18.1]